jgi:hypothetical protein
MAAPEESLTAYALHNAAPAPTAFIPPGGWIEYKGMMTGDFKAVALQGYAPAGTPDAVGMMGMAQVHLNRYAVSVSEVDHVVDHMGESLKEALDHHVQSLDRGGVGMAKHGVRAGWLQDGWWLTWMISHTILDKTTRNYALHVRRDIGGAKLKVVASISGKKRTPEENDALVDEALAFACGLQPIRSA